MTINYYLLNNIFSRLVPLCTGALLGIKSVHGIHEYRIRIFVYIRDHMTVCNAKLKGTLYS